MRKIDVFECDFDCGFYKKTKSSVANHELRCFHNPQSRSCITCIYLKGGMETECYEGVEFKACKLQTQCEKHMTEPNDIEEKLKILESQGHIKIIQP